MSWIGNIFDTIKKPSSPHPGTYAGFPADQDDWTAYQFIDYFEANRTLEGQDQAYRYLSDDIDQLNAFATLYDSKFDCNVLRYFTNEIGQDFPTLLGYPYCGIKGAVSGASRTLEAITKPGILIGFALVAGALIAYPYIKPILKKKKRGRS